MEQITPIAGALSTYGLYAIVAVLVLVVIYLFKMQKDLEKELRVTMKQSSEDMAKTLSQYATDHARLLEQTTEALKDNSKAFSDFQAILMELKQSVQIALERIK